MSLLSIVEREIADLERKLAALKATRAAYMGDAAAPEAFAAPRAMASRPPRQQQLGFDERPGSRRSTRNAAALEEAKRFVGLQGRATPTQVIYDYLVQQGIEVSGNRPQNTLSAMLSNSPDFQNIDRKGWMLTSTARENTEAADATSPSKDAPAASFEPRLTSEGTPQHSAP